MIEVGLPEFRRGIAVVPEAAIKSAAFAVHQRHTQRRDLEVGPVHDLGLAENDPTALAFQQSSQRDARVKRADGVRPAE